MHFTLGLSGITPSIKHEHKTRGRRPRVLCECFRLGAIPDKTAASVCNPYIYLLKRSIAKGLQVKTLSFWQTGETRNVSIGLNLVIVGIVAPAEQKGEGRSISFVFGAPENFKQVIFTITVAKTLSSERHIKTE